MHEMGPKRAQPPDGSAAAIRVAGGEVRAKPTGRVYTAEYKQRVLREVEELRIKGEPGSIGAFLRREGLYSATVMKWARARDAAEKRALTPAKRGRKLTHDPVAEENERLRKQNEKLQKELRKAEIIIDVQKKLAALLGIEVPEVPDPEKDGTS